MPHTEQQPSQLQQISTGLQRFGAGIGGQLPQLLAQQNQQQQQQQQQKIQQEQQQIRQQLILM